MEASLAIAKNAAPSFSKPLPRSDHGANSIEKSSRFFVAISLIE
jgi:hypothetical protein